MSFEGQMKLINNVYCLSAFHEIYFVHLGFHVSMNEYDLEIRDSRLRYHQSNLNRISVSLKSGLSSAFIG